MIAEPPRVQGKVLGFRAWRLDGYKLRPIGLCWSMHWTIGVNEAQCLRDEVRPGYLQELPEHIAPGPPCECGLHAMHAVHSLLNSGRVFYGGGGIARGIAIFGAVLAWGRLEVHDDGFRAQYAEPVMCAHAHWQTHEEVRRARAIMSELGLPFVPLAELPKRAKAYGEPVAPELCPPSPAGVP